MIGPLPATGRACGDLTEEALHDRVELGRGVVRAGGGQDVPVHVELPLLPGGVSDPHRPAAPQTRPGARGSSRSGSFPIHAEDGLRLADRLTIMGDSRHPRQVSLGFVGARRLLEGMHHQARVA